MNLLQANVIFLLLLSLVIFLFIISKIVKKKYPIYMWIIALYIFLIFLQLIISYYYHLKKPHVHGVNSPISKSAFVFTIFEYSAFSFLLSGFISLRLIKKYLIFSCFLFTIIAILIGRSSVSFVHATSIVTTIEGIALIPFCLYHIFELLSRPPLFKLSSEPSFWITVGILFLFVSITPFYLAIDYFLKTPEMQMLDFLGYYLVILFLTKACLVNFKTAHD